jgi:hypothetical protein
VPMSSVPSLTYAHNPATMAPVPMRAPRIWEQAWSLRRQLGHGENDDLIVDPTRIAEEVVVNGKPLALCWDFEHEVHNARGEPAFGICMHLPDGDPEVPRMATLSINGPAIGSRHWLRCSTAIHELGHAVYDVPSWIRAHERGEANPNAVNRCITSDEKHLGNRRRPKTPADWSEWRANEFMGGFLAPEFLLRRELHCLRKELDFPAAMVEGTGDLFGESGHRLVIDLERLCGFDQIVLLDAMAVAFGLSDMFMKVRLEKYKLVKGRFMPV